MDQACRWVIKYFSFLSGNAVPNDDIIVTSVQHAVVTAAIRHGVVIVSLCAGWQWTF